jgi:hypothetical protein
LSLGSDSGGLARPPVSWSQPFASLSLPFEVRLELVGWNAKLPPNTNRREVAALHEAANGRWGYEQLLRNLLNRQMRRRRQRGLQHCAHDDKQSAGRAAQVTDRDNKIRYGARVHLAWITSTPEWNGALARTRELGQRDRRNALPLREYAPNEVLARAPSRASSDYLAARAVLQSVLPPKLSTAVQVLELGVAIEVGLGLAISEPSRAEKLQEACRRRLLGKPLTDAQRQRLRRDLRLIDPHKPPTICARTTPSYAPEVGDAVALHATAAGQGFVLAGPSVAGQPVIGRVRGREGPYSSLVHVEVFVL